MSAPLEVEIEPIESRPFAQISYVVGRKGASEVFVVDPGFDPDAILRHMRRRGLVPVAFVCTHGHADHIAGNGRMKEEFPDAPLVIGRNEASLLGDPQANLSAPFGAPIVSPPADRLLDEGETVEFAGLTFEVREIPGHSPGSIVLICRGTEPAFVLGGDVLFAGSVGRTDFPGGSMKTLADGIRTKLFALPDETIVLPGHGPPTTVGDEKRDNPYVGSSSGFGR